MKTTSYMENIIAREQALAAGSDEVLFLNEKGHLTEGTVSNMFLVTPAMSLVTPPVKSGLLPGITRKFVMELAAKQGIKVIEADVSLNELRHFSEAFLTNSIIEIVPLVSLAGRRGSDRITIGGGKPGQLTGQLITAYKEVVRQQASGTMSS
jgi:branched-subunit amino acid aminotransferase/4-amino-4-deoxychorismate lyase